MPVGGDEDALPWLVDTERQAKFAFSVRYDDSGSIAKQSDFHFAYTTQQPCSSRHGECHRFAFNASQIGWLTTTGANREVVTFGGVGTLQLDDAKRDVAFVVTAQDGFRAGMTSGDIFGMTLYDGQNPYTSPLLYYVSPTTFQRGNIHIRQ